ncbi:MAG: NAD(P)H-dependent glycerol-3-phosphate dehydrogenase [Peptoniphilaceae bacterium]|nr:NAD(P)-dependent glycerol-3-phosphate dehydrogenase [Peptoniphilaceae bacterium]MDD7383463.1 NAD(P)-dependent glycerol-3-phosphate dehydrogenase [Peptoniphilaceae bacterium]MDY3738475.1 NAD(P)H-dependent glycerol-3-phosphate dehydrogenase [Peptoniphilaceae bacterium]
MQISVIGSGNWGSAIAKILSKKNDVLLYTRSEEIEKEINKNHINKKYFPNIKLDNIVATTDLKRALKNKYIVNAIPAQSTRVVFEKYKNFLDSSKTLVNLSKGLEINTNYRMSEVFKDINNEVNYAIISGPSYAIEVINEMPTAVVCASNKLEIAKEIQKIFATDFFRLYTSDDVVGVELGGSLKNILALSIGIADGIGYESNPKAALITRGLHEMERFAKFMGAKEETLMGLSGVGDLILTSTSLESRNFSCGRLIGTGVDPKEAEKQIGTVEGIATTKAIYELSKKMKIYMPITEQTYKILFEKKDPKISVIDLMKKDMKDEGQ